MHNTLVYRCYYSYLHIHMTVVLNHCKLFVLNKMKLNSKVYNAMDRIYTIEMFWQ